MCLGGLRISCRPLKAVEAVHPAHAVSMRSLTVECDGSQHSCLCRQQWGRHASTSITLLLNTASICAAGRLP